MLKLELPEEQEFWVIHRGEKEGREWGRKQGKNLNRFSGRAMGLGGLEWLSQSGE